ncbi:LOG2 [Symbiodinium sp. CCMP2592]|nr:LOG2 [Symbiodinium sp. CCMP2592]
MPRASCALVLLAVGLCPCWLTSTCHRPGRMRGTRVLLRGRHRLLRAGEVGGQARRAAKFWDWFYGSRLQPPEGCQAERPEAVGTEWISRPDALLPKLLEAFRRRCPETILEIGCGDSSLAQQLHENLGGAMLAVDISEEALRRAAERAAGRSGLRFAVADATDLGHLFEDGEVGAVVDKGLADTLHHGGSFARGRGSPERSEGFTDEGESDSGIRLPHNLCAVHACAVRVCMPKFSLKLSMMVIKLHKFVFVGQLAEGSTLPAVATLGQPPPVPERGVAESLARTEKAVDKFSGEGGSLTAQDCAICMSERRDTAVLPCRHMCLCSGCAETMRTQIQYHSYRCPICRERVSSLLQVRAEAPQEP